MKKMNKKGFTLIEMLVVIAIIAILVAIVIPVVSSATEKAKEAKDAANIRSAIAEVTVNGISGKTGTDLEKTVNLTQTGAFDQNADLVTEGNIGGFPLSTFNGKSSVTIKFNPDTQEITVNGVAASTEGQS